MNNSLQKNGLFRFFDRIPFFRRSGKASRADLAKGLFITLALAYLMQIPQIIAHPWMALLSLAVLAPLLGLILLMHPFLSHRATLRESLGLKKRA